MLNNKSLLAVISSALFLVLNGCTKNFKELNTNPAGVTEEVFAADYGIISNKLKNVQKAIVHYTNWKYQLQENLNADIYSGYMMSPTPFNGGSNNTNYYMMDGWNQQILDIAYNEILDVLVKQEPASETSYTGVDFSDVHAMVKILKVEAGHRTSDIFGPMIYTKYGYANSDLSVDYDTQETLYKQFFVDLDSARILLKPYADGTKTIGTAFKNSDLTYSGSATKWLQFLNTLELRLALRIVYVNPTLAQAQGEIAMDPTNGGLITDYSNNALVSLGSAHPIYDIITSWTDIRAGAPLLCYLKGYSDPRLAKFATTATTTNVSGQYIGIRNGVNIDAKSRYVNYSSPQALSAAGDYFDSKSGLVKLASASEAYFLMAEAALRGWNNAGTASTNYENGITQSFNEWGVSSSLTTYLANSTSTEAVYTDPNAVTSGQNNIATGSAYLSTITIKWNASATFEQNLERIITQKWLCLYPDGQEAWSEFRRTGYPKLFPVVINNSAGTISTSQFIRRLPIPNTYRTNNAIGYNKILSSLGGADNGGTKLWWDAK